MTVSSILLETVGPLIAAALALLVGHPVAAWWSAKQKRREMTLSAALEFHRLYGEFFAVWKLWEFARKEKDADFRERRWTLMNRAAAAEAGMESLFVRLATERSLSEYETESLGKFRQAFQQLREAVRDDRSLGWSMSEYKPYAAFKSLATITADLVARSDRSRAPTVFEAQKALATITANMWEPVWTEPVSIRGSRAPRRDARSSSTDPAARPR